MKLRMRLLIILLTIALGLMSCQSYPEENTTTLTVNPVAPAVLLTVEIADEYTDGVFLIWDEWGKVKINQTRLQREIEQLRAELKKFESTE